MDIKDYLVIGDLHTCALVDKGSVDWMCIPHFDSASIFARLLDENAGGFSIKSDGYKITSGYLRHTAIVESIFENNNGKFSLKDFMVPQPKQTCDSHILVRKVTGIEGSSKVTFMFYPKPNYARDEPKLKEESDKLVLANKNGDIYLHYPPGTKIVKKRDGYELTLSVNKHESKQIILYEGICGFENKDYENKTKKFWQEWINHGRFLESCRERLVRSAITLKLMQYFPSGAIVAAPTTSLPEEIGGIRNWDYRYAWVRDATFTLYGFYVLGFTEEAEKFFGFIESIANKCNDKTIDINLLYTIEGKQPVKEQELKHLSGYKNSKPVRIGNGAVHQFQLDIYGSLIDAYYFMAKRGLRISKHGKNIVIGLVNTIKNRWMQRDNGIWEVRGKTQHYTYSKVMAWVGVNRAVQLCDKLGISGKTAEEWKKLENEIKNWIWDNCYDKKSSSFFQYPGSKNQDATNLLFVLLQFLDKKGPKTREIIEKTSKELSYGKLFVYRYLGNDGLEGEEGAFILCTFWLISALAILGDVGKAENLFKKFEEKIKGLISEEIDPKTGEYLGNYPQAFSHIGYIMSAYYIERYKKRR